MENQMICVAAELITTAAEKGKERMEFLQNTVVPMLRVKIEGCLNRDNIIQAVRSALQKAGIWNEEDPIKAAIQEIREQDDSIVVDIDVLDMGLGNLQVQIEMECEQIDFDLRPGDIIYEEI